MSDSSDYRVIFGLGGAWGFAPGDMTSPARAAGQGAFTDRELPPYEPDFTELRVHGVSGSSGPTMLEHPAALQVAGDGTTMFYRRWTPAGAGGAGVPWKLEAYSWGGLTESPLASASWLLFAPFMLYNLAHFALPPQKKYTIGPVEAAAAPARAADSPDGSPGHAQRDRTGDASRAQLDRDAWHGRAAALLRLLAFSGTLQLTAVIVSVLVNSAGLQAPNAHLPSWLLWYPQWPAGGRIALALGGAAVGIALMWLISVKTTQRYEARTSRARPAVNENWPLTQTQFWMGQELVQRQRSLHSGGALAITALIVSRPAHIGDMGGGRLALLAESGLVLLLIAATLCGSVADRHTVTLVQSRIPPGAGKGNATRGSVWCRVLLAGGAAVFAGGFFTSGWPAERKTAPVSLPGFTNACAFLLAAQAFLLVVLAFVVWWLARSAPEPDPATRPFGAGHLTSIFAVLAVCLGGVFSAVTDLFATRLIGTPVPSGIRFSPHLAHALQVPWPIYAFGAAPVGMLLGLLIAVAWVACRSNQDAKRFAAVDPAAGKSEVAAFYGCWFGDADAAGYEGCRKRIARAWAVGQLVTRAAVVAMWAAAGMIAATLTAEIYAALTSPHSALGVKLHGLASAESVVGLAVGGVLLGLLRSAYSNPSKRKTIGAIWDVGTFWPRAAHPLAPPCYAERAVPELVDRIRILTGTVAADARDPAWLQIKAHERNSSSADSPHLWMPPGPVLLTGYSQGAIIAPAVVAQLPAETRQRAALLTLACPARQLYGRAFPAYFGEKSLDMLRELLRDDHRGHTAYKWKNLVRRTDYIGSWIFSNPDGTDPGLLLTRPKEIDQPCWDPVTVTADLDPTPPPIHRHTGFWQDPRVTQLGKHLGLTSFRT